MFVLSVLQHRYCQSWIISCVTKSRFHVGKRDYKVIFDNSILMNAFSKIPGCRISGFFFIIYICGFRDTYCKANADLPIWT